MQGKFKSALQKVQSLFQSKVFTISFIASIAVVFVAVTVFIIVYSDKGNSVDTGNEIPTEPTTEAENMTEDELLPPESSDIAEDPNTKSEPHTEVATEEVMSDTENADSLSPPLTTQPTTTDNADPNAPPKYYSYLTGMECTEEEQRKRPAAVMINNIKAALPNVGTSYADIIYECLVEGGQARLMAIVSDYKNVPVFGSVRSSRDYYVDLLQAHDAIYVHAGGSDMAYVEFRDRNIDRLDGVNPVNGYSFPNTFYRDANRRKTMALEHTLMASGSGILKGIQEKGYRTTLKENYTGTFNFFKRLTDMGVNGSPATYISVPYSASFKPEFIYNAEDGLYYRKQFGAAHVDGGNGEQLKFRNVLVLFADYVDLQTSKGQLACDLTGTGYGFYISHGKYKTIKWQKSTRDSEFNLTNLNGAPLYINQGKSFICVTSTVYNKSVVITDEIRSYK